MSIYGHGPPEAIHRPAQSSNTSSVSSVFIPQPDRVSALEQRFQQLVNQVQQSNTDTARLAATVDSNQQQLLAILGTLLVTPSTAVILLPALHLW